MSPLTNSATALVDSDGSTISQRRVSGLVGGEGIQRVRHCLNLFIAGFGDLADHPFVRDSDLRHHAVYRVVDDGPFVVFALDGCGGRSHN